MPLSLYIKPVAYASPPNRATPIATFSVSMKKKFDFELYETLQMISM